MLLKNIISFVLITTVLLPFAVQFSHAINAKHEYTVYSTQQKINIDQHDKNCAFFHYQINYNAIPFSSSFSVAENILRKEKTLAVETQISSVKIQYKSSRAPPMLLLS